MTWAVPAIQPRRGGSDTASRRGKVGRRNLTSPQSYLILGAPASQAKSRLLPYPRYEVQGNKKKTIKDWKKNRVYQPNW